MHVYRTHAELGAGILEPMFLLRNASVLESTVHSTLHKRVKHTHCTHIAKLVGVLHCQTM